jgi:DNA-binding transcriptional ArsR family regulator
MSDANGPNRRLAEVGVRQPEVADWIKAISVPQRRRILRTLHHAGEARSPNELANAFKTSVGNVSYHVKVLKKCNVVALTDTQQKRGAVEHFYASTRTDNKLARKLLRATKSGDEAEGYG